VVHGIVQPRAVGQQKSRNGSPAAATCSCNKALSPPSSTFFVKLMYIATKLWSGACGVRRSRPGNAARHIGGSAGGRGCAAGARGSAAQQTRPGGPRCGTGCPGAAEPLLGGRTPRRDPSHAGALLQCPRHYLCCNTFIEEQSSLLSRQHVLTPFLLCRASSIRRHSRCPTVDNGCRPPCPCPVLSRAGV
jgi:hypothetical protein